MTEIPEISGQCVPQEEERDLYDQRQAFHDELETPSDHPPHLRLPVTIAIYKRSLDIKVQPLLRQRSQECRQQSTCKGAEEDRLDLNDGGVWTGPRGKLKFV